MTFLIAYAPTENVILLYEYSISLVPYNVLRFLDIILRVFRIEVSVYNVYNKANELQRWKRERRGCVILAACMYVQCNV